MKTVLVTGGSRGIGRAVVERFAKAGYRVAFTYLSSEEQARELAEKTGALAILADSAKEADVTSAVERTERELGPVDVLVNNAGVAHFGLLTDLSLEDWNRLFTVNVTGAFLYSREVLRSMIRRHTGRIVNISSMWGLVGSSCEVAYSAGKAAIIGMTRALAKEVGPSGITVNAVAPGVIRTDMNARLDAETMGELADETPVMRIGEPAEVAETVFFLASDGAAFITGEVVNVSGGFVIG